jgi:hypothetical protein
MAKAPNGAFVTRRLRNPDRHDVAALDRARIDRDEGDGIDAALAENGATRSSWRRRCRRIPASSRLIRGLVALERRV